MRCLISGAEHGRTRQDFWCWWGYKPQPLYEKTSMALATRQGGGGRAISLSSSWSGMSDGESNTPRQEGVSPTSDNKVRTTKCLYKEPNTQVRTNREPKQGTKNTSQNTPRSFPPDCLGTVGGGRGVGKNHQLMMEI